MYLYKVGTQSSVLINQVSLFQGCPLRWRGSLSAEVNENINLGYGQDQGYS